jgi:hypothetical protein
MSDVQQGQDTSAAAPSAPVAPTPVAESPAPAAVTETPAAPAIEAPAAETPAVETPAPEAPIENILGDVAEPETKPDAKPEGDKAADTKPSTETPSVTDAKVELPVYEEFKLPENYNADKESLGQFTQILGEIESGKLDHKGYQEAGQKLVDLGTKAIQDSINRLNDYYVQIHESQKKEWFDNFKKDPEMGGSEEKIKETVTNLREAINEYAGTEAQQEEFRQVMKETGVGNHPALIRMLNNMAQKIQKYTTEGNENRMVPGAKPAPSKVKPHQLFYSQG